MSKFTKKKKNELVGIDNIRVEIFTHDIDKRIFTFKIHRQLAYIDQRI